MSGFDGYRTEMPDVSPEDRALEAFLRGTASAPPDLEWLASFSQDLLSITNEPAPVPAAALAVLLTEGFSIEKGDLPATAASNVPGPALQAAGPPKWRKRMGLSEMLSGIPAKLAGLGLATKAGLGIGLASIGLTGAAAAGVLPAPAHDAVTSVVEAATPFELADDLGKLDPAKVIDTVDDITDDAVDTVDENIDDPTAGVIDDVSGDSDDSDSGSDEAGSGDEVRDNHGACVSAVAKTVPRGPGGIHGAAVSAAAKSCDKGHDRPATSTTVAADDDETTGTRPGRGAGQANGHGSDR